MTCAGKVILTEPIGLLRRGVCRESDPGQGPCTERRIGVALWTSRILCAGLSDLNRPGQSIELGSAALKPHAVLQDDLNLQRRQRGFGQSMALVLAGRANDRLVRQIGAR